MSEAYPYTGINSLSYSWANQNTNNLPIPTELGFDFEKDCFMYDDDGKHVIVEGDDAIKVWVYKALKTERFQYFAYSWQYGLEIKPFIGKVMGVSHRKSELRRVIIECLMVNPYIKSIDYMTITAVGDSLTVDVTLTTVYGKVNINV